MIGNLGHPTENLTLSRCQICRQWWHRRLSLWQPPMPPVATNLASCQLEGFCEGLFTTCASARSKPKRKDDTWSHGHGKVVTLITSSSLEMLKAANRHKLDLQRLEKATQYQADEYMSLFLTYRWLGARLQYLQCVSNGDTAVLH